MTMNITEIIQPRDQGFLAEDICVIEQVAADPQWSEATTADDFLAEMAQWQ